MHEAVVYRNIQPLNLNNKRNAEPGYWALFLVSMMLKCFYFQFTTQANRRPFVSEDNLRMLLASFSVILIMIAFTFTFFNRKRNTALFIVNLLFSAILLADTNFYRYYYNAISIPVFYQMNVSMVGSVNSSIMSLFKPKDILYLADLPIMIIWLSYIRKHSLMGSVQFIRRLAISLGILALAAGCFFGVYRKVDAESFPYDNNYIVKSMGIFYFHFYDAKEFINEKLTEGSGLSDDEQNMLQSFYKDREKENAGEGEEKYNGAAAGKNLLTVQVEALQGFVINREVNGKEITPNLNKLIKQSLYFNNIYYQVAGGNTSDAEFLSNTSLYPLREGAVYHRFPENTYESTAKLLKAEGYTAYAAHAFYPTFWNRNEMYKALGFDRFISQDDFIMDEFAGWDGESALSDISFFRQTLDKMDTSKPFYSFMVTLSSHHPFEYFKDYDFDVGELEGTYMGNYLKAANYADKSIGVLMDELKKRGLYDNTMLVLYGDHSAVPKHLSEELYSFLQIEESEPAWMKLQKVPLVIHYPGVNGGQVIKKTGGQIDIQPTIANLMGLEASNALGKDLLNTKEGYAILRNGSVITDQFVYSSNLREAYDARTDETLERTEYDETLDRLLRQLEMSDTIVFKDALKKEN